MTWPQRIPPDLRRELDQINSYRDPPTPQDAWAVLREWLERHGLDAPDTLPEDQPLPTRAER